MATQTTRAAAKPKEATKEAAKDAAKAATTAAAPSGVQMTGAEMVVRALVDQGVEHDLFGYPGGAVLPIYDALFHQTRLRHMLVRHEQGAAHAAEGYARSTGKVGCVLVTSGPGATNAVTGHHRCADGLDPAGGASPARCRRT